MSPSLYPRVLVECQLQLIRYDRPGHPSDQRSVGLLAAKLLTTTTDGARHKAAIYVVPHDRVHYNRDGMESVNSWMIGILLPSLRAPELTGHGLLEARLTGENDVVALLEIPTAKPQIVAVAKRLVEPWSERVPRLDNRVRPSLTPEAIKSMMVHTP